MPADLLDPPRCLPRHLALPISPSLSLPWHDVTGFHVTFCPPTLLLLLPGADLTTDTQLTAWIRAQTPGMSATDAAAFLRLYPNVQSAGSPYNTGSVKFLWKLFKRSSSMLGDLAFEAPRRYFLRAANLLDAANQAAAANSTLVQTVTTTTQPVEDQPVGLTLVASNSTNDGSGSNTTMSTFEGTFTGNITNTTTVLTPFQYAPLKVWSYQFSQTPAGGYDYLGGASRLVSMVPGVGRLRLASPQPLTATRSRGCGRRAPRPRSAQTAFATPCRTCVLLSLSPPLVLTAPYSETQAWIYFTNFLDPNGPTSPVFWPQYLQSNKTQLQFKLGQQSLISVRTSSMTAFSDHTDAVSLLAQDRYRSSAIDFINGNQAIVRALFPSRCSANRHLAECVLPALQFGQ